MASSIAMVLSIAKWFQVLLNVFKKYYGFKYC